MLSDMRVTTRIYLWIGLVFLVLLLVGSYTVVIESAGNTALLTMADTTGVGAKTADLADDARFHFKVQIQEWKNVLIRGHDKADYDRYFLAMNREAELVRKKLREARSHMQQLGVANTEIDAVLAEHEALTARYRAAAAAFDPAAPNAIREADRGVRGIDRKATDMIDRVAETVRQSVRTQLDHSRDAAVTRHQATLTAMGVALALAVGLGVFIWFRLIATVARPINQVVDATDQFRSGDADLTRKLPRMQGEFGRLAESMNGFIDSLHDLASRVAVNSREIANASQQISAGNMDLSARTQEQASALEETAASVEEFSSAVRQGADSTRLASGLAQSASTAAQKGGRIAAQAVLEISSVQAGSRKISEITGIIDSIAFQTNILALNAAVEAARAGEQGRGFAVVAAEVRSLAQRSATAAKEIKGLIGTTIEQVERGSQFVNDAGAAMQATEVAIQQVTEIINEIAGTSGDQATAVDQINRTITQMEQVTQQNAALVEEAAAATESMRDQAQELTELVARFKLDDATLREDQVRSRRNAALTDAPAARPAKTRIAIGARSHAPVLPKDVGGEWREF